MYIIPMSTNASDKIFNQYRDEYIQILEPLFFPKMPPKYDIVSYFSSLLRATGAEDSGWDPYSESRGLLFDLNSIFTIKLPKRRFPNPALTQWRIGLFMYSHILEMDAPYEVITNLMRYQLGHGYYPNPYYKFLNRDGRNKLKNRGLYPLDKIEIIKKLDKELGTKIGSIFDEFYDADLRNAISHSDFVITDTQFRVRKNRTRGAYSIKLDELDTFLTKAKAFIGSVFYLDHVAREYWGKNYGNKALPYDRQYKGLMEILTDKDGLMSGFKVHWPNGSESFYNRSEKGASMVNCYVAENKIGIELLVNMYANSPGVFSPLVEINDKAKYSKLQNGELPSWSE
jgi:hypothetical protein